ncbi:MAG: DMT family transporter, partial [Candidatus Marinimicrobia bacterium]|nr:DMT family transporter [Candidatus Neomarinimicrobiota bacterium]
MKIGLEDTPPILAVGLRFAISATILWVIFLFRKEQLVLTKDAVKVYLAFGVINFSCSYSLTYWGTQYIHSGLSAVIWSTFPIVVVLFAHFMLRNDRITTQKSVGVLFGLIGTAMIFVQDKAVFEGFDLKAVAAVSAAVLLAAWPNILYKKHQKEIPHFHLNVVSQTIAVSVLLPVSFLIEDPLSVEWSLRNTAALFYLAIPGTAIVWSIYFWLYKHLKVTQISTIALIPPIIAVILGWQLLGEQFTPRMLAGAILIFSGVLFVNYRQSRPPAVETTL